MAKANKRRNDKRNTPTTTSTPLSTPVRPMKKADEKKTPEKIKGKKDKFFPPGDMRAFVNKVTPKQGEKCANEDIDEKCGYDAEEKDHDTSILSSDDEVEAVSYTHLTLPTIYSV